MGQHAGSLDGEASSPTMRAAFAACPITASNTLPACCAVLLLLQAGGGKHFDADWHKGISAFRPEDYEDQAAHLHELEAHVSCIGLSGGFGLGAWPCKQCRFSGNAPQCCFARDFGKASSPSSWRGASLQLLEVHFEAGL
jgi:hypothetical protein